MAAKKTTKGTSEKVNKSELIRGYFADHPEAKAKEVKEALAAKGIDVSEQVVYQVKRAASGSPKSKSSANGSVEALTAQLEAAKLVLKMGGIKQAKDALAKVADQPIFAFAVRAGSIEKAQQLIDQLAD